MLTKVVYPEVAVVWSLGDYPEKYVQLTDFVPVEIHRNPVKASEDYGYVNGNIKTAPADWWIDVITEANPLGLKKQGEKETIRFLYARLLWKDYIYNEYVGPRMKLPASRQRAAEKLIVKGSAWMDELMERHEGDYLNYEVRYKVFEIFRNNNLKFQIYLNECIFSRDVEWEDTAVLEAQIKENKLMSELKAASRVTKSAMTDAVMLEVNTWEMPDELRTAVQEESEQPGTFMKSMFFR